MNPDPEPNPFEEIGPVETEEFVFAVQKGIAAARYRVPMRGPGTRRFRVADEEGGPDATSSFADTSMNRFMFAVLDEYPRHSPIAKAIVVRFHALNALGAKGHLDDWAPSSEVEPGAASLHPALLHAAAVAPLNSEGEFDPGPFLDRVAVIAATLPSTPRPGG